MKKINAVELKKDLAIADAAITGIELVRKTVWPSRRINGLNFVSCDLRSLVMGGFFGGPTFDDVTWTDVDLDGLNARRTKFNNCTFSRATIGDKLMTNLHGCSFERCAFNELVLKNVFFINCTFNECRLNTKQAYRVNFNNCKVSDSQLIGVWEKINFVEGNLVRTDFTRAVLSDSVFYPNVLTDVTFPTSMEGNVVK